VIAARCRKDSTVLITASGTGKEVPRALSISKQSPRQVTSPYCGSIARRFRTTCWKPRCSAMSRVRLARFAKVPRASSSWLRAALFCPTAEIPGLAGQLLRAARGEAYGARRFAWISGYWSPVTVTCCWRRALP
jgi:hypothetical protein